MIIQIKLTKEEAEHLANPHTYDTEHYQFSTYTPNHDDSPSVGFDEIKDKYRFKRCKRAVSFWDQW